MNAIRRASGLIINIIWGILIIIIASEYTKTGKVTGASFGILFSLSDEKACINDELEEYKDVCTVTDIDKLFDNYYSARVSSAAYQEDELIELLRQNKTFSVLEKDGQLSSDARLVTKNDTYMKDQWYLDRIGANEFYSGNSKVNGSGVVVAVIDTGVNYSHPDIRNNMWVNSAEYYGIPGVDDDGNGIADDIYGADFVNDTGDPMDNDSAGHGSHVAGIIAMTANNGGGRGIAYGSRIMALKAGDSKGSFTISNVIKAIKYAEEMGADIINMSFGSYNESEVMKAALESAADKCILVAAAGNEGVANTESGIQGAASVYPAAYPFVIGVMAEDEQAQLTSWSNYDVNPFTNDEYEIAAPGHNILSIAGYNRYVYMSGTSMAAPMVSAAAAVIYGALDKENVSEPLKYVAGAITRSSTCKAVKTIDESRFIQYNSLNLKDAYASTPKVDIQIGGIHFEDSSGNIKFTDEYTFNDAESKELYCGFVVDNTWMEAENVSVRVSSGNEALLINNPVVAIGKMQSRTKLNIECDKYEAVGLTFKGEMNKSYVIPLKFEILRTEKNSEEIIVSNTIEKTITLSVSNNNNLQNQTTTPVVYNDSEPTKPETKSMKTYIKVAWDDLLKAEGYYVYRSLKKQSGYHKLADIKTADRYYYKDYTAKAGKKYYYKIKAYYSDGRVSSFSNISMCMRLGKVKGIKAEGRTIKWKKVSGASGYEVFYSKNKNGQYKKISTVNTVKAPYQYKGKKKGYFKIRARAQVGKEKVCGIFSKIIHIQ